MELLIAAGVGLLLGLIGIGLVEYVRHRRRRRQIAKAFETEMKRLEAQYEAQIMTREQLANEVEQIVNSERRKP